VPSRDVMSQPRALALVVWLAVAMIAACVVRSDPVELGGLDSGTHKPKVDGGGFDPDDPPAPDDPSGFDVGPGGTPAPSDASCGGATENAAPVPLDIFIMLDRSGSMKDATSTGATKWDATKDAFKSFMSDPATVGIAVGLQYFGHTGLFSDGKSSCAVSDYATADVEIAPLPGVAAAINKSLALHIPNTDTPTGPALQGALQHAHNWQAAHPGHLVVVVLATDGLPSACTPDDIPSIAAFASAAAAEKPAIRTYVIGVLSDDDITAGADKNLDDISKAGNGDGAFIIESTSTDVSKAFIAALQKIRGFALGCEYLVPTGAGADYNKVNVVVNSGGKKTTLPYVGSKAKCDPATGGWYYDIPPGSGTPTKILTCDATCKSLSVDSTGKIEIQVGCATVVPK
jgi:hypothetical protein